MVLGKEFRTKQCEPLNKTHRLNHSFKIVSFISVLIGVLKISVNVYWIYQYTNGDALWLYMTPMYQLISNLLFGVGFIFCGVRLFKGSGGMQMAYNILSLGLVFNSALTLMVGDGIPGESMLNMLLGIMMPVYINKRICKTTYGLALYKKMALGVTASILIAFLPFWLFKNYQYW